MSDSAAQELQSFVRRIEALDDEIRALNSDKSEVFKEVKGAGFTAKTLRKVVAARRMDAADRDEADAEFELYWNAVHGIEADYVRAHVEIIDEIPPATANDTQATTPLPEDQGQRAAVSIAQEHRPAEANGLVKGPSEPEGSGGVQDRCESTPPTNLATFTPKPLRPYCLNPGNKCGGMGRKHCSPCERAQNEKQGAA